MHFDYLQSYKTETVIGPLCSSLLTHEPKRENLEVDAVDQHSTHLSILIKMVPMVITWMK